jgi:peptidoglycan hydrolase CwlO-like protein
MRREPDIFERMTKSIGSSVSFVLHTIAFIAAFAVGILKLAPWDTVLLVLTTIVSLEAIYLSIFIQMTVNRQAAELAEVSEDVDEIQEDIDEVQKDIDEIQEDVDEIQEDIEEITEEE